MQSRPLDEHAIRVYYRAMPGVKGLEWNKVQLGIAQLIQHKLTSKQIQEQLGVSINTVNKVKQRMTHGEDPGPVTDEMIAAAKEPSKFGDHGLPVTPHEPPGNGAKPETAAEKPKPPAATNKQTTAVTQTSFLKFIAQIQPVAMTQQISSSYICAVKKGYEGDLGDWLGYVSEDFWTGRGYNPYQEVVGFESKVTNVKEEVTVGQQAG